MRANATRQLAPSKLCRRGPRRISNPNRVPTAADEQCIRAPPLTAVIAFPSRDLRNAKPVSESVVAAWRPLLLLLRSRQPQCPGRGCRRFVVGMAYGKAQLRRRVWRRAHSRLPIPTKKRRAALPGCPGFPWGKCDLPTLQRQYRRSHRPVQVHHAERPCLPLPDLQEHVRARRRSEE